jgi:hypothetical protein
VPASRQHGTYGEVLKRESFTEPLKCNFKSLPATPEQGPVCSPFHTDVLRTMLKYVYTVIQVCRTHISKCLINYRSSILTPTRQSSNPWGLQINFFTLLMSPLHLAAINTAMGGYQAGSHKKQKPIRNLPAVSTLSINPPRGRPPSPDTPESPTRHNPET